VRTASWLTALLLGMGATGAWIARRRGRSAVAWFFLAFVGHIPVLLIILALPRLRLTCPRCSTSYRRGAMACAACGEDLPDAALADRLIPGETYDQRCPQCRAPYRTSDYQPDTAHIFCTACRGELPPSQA